MSTIQRITGTNSGLDVDTLVKTAMQPYKTKIDREVQNQKVLQYQQEQYKQIMSDASGFYDKYCDILKTGNLMSTSSYNTVSFESGDKTKVTAKGFAGASVDNYTVSVTQVASRASITLADGITTKQSMTFGSGVNSVSLTFDVGNDGKTAKENATKTIDNYNTAIATEKTKLTDKLKTANSTDKLTIQDQLNSLNVTATYSEFSKGIVFTADQMGQGGFALGTDPANDKELKGTITKTKDGVLQSFDLTGTSNTVTVDNVQFSLKAPTMKVITTDLVPLTVANGETKTENGKTTTKDATGDTITTTQVGTDGSVTQTVTKNANTSPVTTTTIDTPTSLAGETDATEVKDKIVKFVNDYNTLLQSINTKIYETRDKDYMPLTDEQKKSMSEDQITAWEKKAQTGLLRKDSDLERITSEMKSAMSSVMSGSGSYLEKIGITPVKDYTDKNGMFTIDEDKLTKALEDNAGNVKDLLTRTITTVKNPVTGKDEVTDKGGILTQLKTSLYSEFKISTSVLSKKAGLVGGSTEYNNTLSTNIYKKKQLIADLNKSLTSKENALYKKYSDLETIMQKLNSQQSSLASMLGQG